MKPLQFNFNIEQLFKDQFGIAPLLGNNKFFDRFSKKKIDVQEDSRDYYLTSGLGIPVWDIVEIEPLIEDGTGKRFPGYRFPAEMTVEAIRAKKVVETDIVGAEGTVEEIVSMDDWLLTFKGFIIGYGDDAYPEEQVAELVRTCGLLHSAKPVISEFLNLLGIDHISIHDLSLPQLAGYSNVQPFEITAKSKRPFIIFIDDGIEL
ncbi:DUF6046 domain-containing protein [Spongiimicrobium salis]|uniref:DUF6046 domain-containing protein n=1 Tax=Spongiimicrobium salis TaxID=1667022 RepID=UPI00374D8F57